MKKVLAHVHIYYQEMWKELKNCLKNIDSDYDLYVTMAEDHKDIVKNILSFKSDAKIEVVENRGFDVGPFVEVLNKVNLDDYEYVIKLHTKRDVIDDYCINHIKVSGNRWRKYLLNFIATQKAFKRSIELLSKNNVGMVSDYRLIINKNGTDKIAETILDNILEKNNLPKIKYSFVAGTMFIAKAEILKPLQNMFCLKDFEISKPRESGLAHAIERFLGYLVCFDNKKIEVSTPKKSFFFMISFCQAANIITDFTCKVKITKSGKKLIKICKIPVYSRRAS